jgi:hypothetical protein
LPNWRGFANLSDAGLGSHRLSRVFAFFAIFVGCAAGVVAVACSADDATTADRTTPTDAGALRRDSAVVELPDAGTELDAALAPPVTCEKYCSSVTENCTGANKQYDNEADCLAFCANLPLEEPNRGGDDKASPSVACRQYWADSPAKTSPNDYCLAAGPFGGGTCGDRCTAFCDLVLSACSPDAGTGTAPYPDQPSCASACAGFSYRDAGTDGGGEGPEDAGPSKGDSLNCRLHELRAAIADPKKCADLKPDSQTCSD